MLQTRHVLITRGAALVRTKTVIYAVYMMIFTLAGIAAFWLRFDCSIPSSRWRNLLFALPVWIIFKMAAARLFRLDRISWRHASMPEAIRVGWATASASFAGMVVLYMLGPSGFPRSIYLLDFLLSFLFWCTALLSIRAFKEITSCSASAVGSKALIYGAGDAGAALQREMRTNARNGFEICGYLDDDPRKIGTYVHGVKVLGPGMALEAIAQRLQIGQVLIAVPSATSSEMARILKYCGTARVRCRTIPSLTEMIEGKELSRQIRDVSVDDLLGRVPVSLDEEQIRESINGRNVLVTGAAGSIGSELCRQIAHFSPACIVGVDTAETGLFYLEIEMKGRYPAVRFCPEIGNIQNRDRMSEILALYRPVSVFHAAAYKHVPLLEMHVFEAIENNVLGTANIALLAAEFSVASFVMISTDKAVHPTSMLGATKRFAELLINSLQSDTTKYVSVRFGNVLGSNGSVIPLFKEQIAAGGPVTVTHPEMMRYFMTIPEAARLVLQASTMGNGGEIFILDMGQPVKIVDLARHLISLSGLVPDLDIQIAFSGVRPGEKLHEELTGTDERVLSTSHPKVRVYAGCPLTPESMLEALGSIGSAIATRDRSAAIYELMRIVQDYQPSESVLLGPQDRLDPNITANTEVASAPYLSLSTLSQGSQVA
jgi:FlaA1/EpsC-like NDP-sugar epimerase